MHEILGLVRAWVIASCTWSSLLHRNLSTAICVGCVTGPALPMQHIVQPPSPPPLPPPFPVYPLQRMLSITLFLFPFLPFISLPNWLVYATDPPATLCLCCAFRGGGGAWGAHFPLKPSAATGGAAGARHSSCLTGTHWWWHAQQLVATSELRCGTYCRCCCYRGGGLQEGDALVWGCNGCLQWWGWGG